MKMTTHRSISTFAEAAVPHYARRGIVTMFMIMLGFTFFSASIVGWQRSWQTDWISAALSSP